MTTAEQGGASSSDYSGVPATVVFSGGETEKTITFTAATDNLEDSGESVKLGLGALPAGVAAGDKNEAVVSIANVCCSKFSLCQLWSCWIHRVRRQHDHGHGIAQCSAWE